MAMERGRILVVDDKAAVRFLLQDILSVRHDVVLAPDGAAAIRALEQEPCEVVLTDVRMPEVDGFGLIRLVKERWPLTEIVMMTAFASISSAVMAMRKGAYDYISKATDPDEVALIVTRALERHRERKERRLLGGTLSADNLAGLSYREALASARDRGSREYLIALLEAYMGNVSRAADRAGLERESLYRLLRRHGLEAGAFRHLPSRGDN